jgi:hypothetical protein
MVRLAAAISMVNVPLALAPAASATVTETVDMPDVAGTPVREAPLSCMPAGSPVALKV